MRRPPGLAVVTDAPLEPDKRALRRRSSLPSLLGGGGDSPRTPKTATSALGLLTRRPRLGRSLSFKPMRRQSFESAQSESSWVDVVYPEEEEDQEQEDQGQGPGQAHEEKGEDGEEEEDLTRSARMRLRQRRPTIAVEAEPEHVSNGDEVVIRPWRGGGCLSRARTEVAVLAARGPEDETCLRLMKVSEGSSRLANGDELLLMAGDAFLTVQDKALLFSEDADKASSVFRISDLAETEAGVRLGAPFTLKSVCHPDLAVARHGGGFNVHLDGVQLVLDSKLPMRFVLASPDGGQHGHLPSSLTGDDVTGEQFFFNALEAAAEAYAMAMLATQAARSGGAAMELLREAFGVSSSTHSTALSECSGRLFSLVGSGEYLGSQGEFLARCRLWFCDNRRVGVEGRAAGDFYHASAFGSRDDAARYYAKEGERLDIKAERLQADVEAERPPQPSRSYGLCCGPGPEMLGQPTDGPAEHTPLLPNHACSPHALYVLLAKTLLQHRNPSMVIAEDLPSRAFAPSLMADAGSWLSRLAQACHTVSPASKKHPLHAVRPLDDAAAEVLRAVADVFGIGPVFCALTQMLLHAQTLPGALRGISPVIAHQEALGSHLLALQDAVRELFSLLRDDEWPVTQVERHLIQTIAEGAWNALEGALAAFREYFPRNRPVGALGTVVDTYLLIGDLLERGPERISVVVRANCVLRMHNMMAEAGMPVVLAPLVRSRLPTAELFSQAELQQLRPPGGGVDSCLRCDGAVETTCRCCAGPVCRACCSHLVLDVASASCLCVCSHCIVQSSRVDRSLGCWANARAFSTMPDALSCPRLRVTCAAPLPPSASSSCMRCERAFGEEPVACGGCGTLLCGACCFRKLYEADSGRVLRMCATCHERAITRYTQAHPPVAGHQFLPHKFFLESVCGVCFALLREDQSCLTCGLAVCEPCSVPPVECDACHRSVCGRCTGPQLFDTNLARCVVVCTGCMLGTFVNYTALRDGTPTVRLGPARRLSFRHEAEGEDEDEDPGACACCSTPFVTMSPCCGGRAGSGCDGPRNALAAMQAVPVSQLSQLIRSVTEQLVEDAEVFAPSFVTVPDLELDKLVAGELYALVEQLVCAALAGLTPDLPVDTTQAVQLLIALRGLWDVFGVQQWLDVRRVDLVEPFDAFVPLWVEATYAKVDKYVLRIFNRDRDAQWQQANATQMHCAASEDLFGVVMTSMAYGSFLLLPEELQRRHKARFVLRVMFRLVLRFASLLERELLALLGQHPTTRGMAALIDALGIATTDAGSGEVHVSQPMCVLLNSLFACQQQLQVCMEFVWGRDAPPETHVLELNVCGAQDLPAHTELPFVEAQLFAAEDAEARLPIFQAAATAHADSLGCESAEQRHPVWHDEALLLLTHTPTARVHLTVRHSGGFVGSCDLQLEPNARYRALVQLQGAPSPAMELGGLAVKRLPRSEFDACVRCGAEFTEETPHQWCASCGGINCAVCCSNVVVDTVTHDTVHVCTHCFKTSKRVQGGATRCTGWLSVDVHFHPEPIAEPTAAELHTQVSALVDRLSQLLGVALRQHVEDLIFGGAHHLRDDLRRLRDLILERPQAGSELLEQKLEPLFQYLEAELSTVCSNLYSDLRTQVLNALWRRLVRVFVELLLPTAEPRHLDAFLGARGPAAPVHAPDSPAPTRFLADEQVEMLTHALPLLQGFFQEGLPGAGLSGAVQPLERLLLLWQVDTAVLVAMTQPGAPTSSTTPPFVLRAVLERRAALGDPEALHVLHSADEQTAVPWEGTGAITIHQGWLKKLGNHVRSWKRRWCVLQRAPDDSAAVYLSYYSKPGGECKAHIPVAKVQRMRGNPWPFGFALEMAAPSPSERSKAAELLAALPWAEDVDGGRVYNFIADTDEELSRWWQELGSVSPAPAPAAAPAEDVALPQDAMSPAEQEQREERRRVFRSIH